MRIILWAKRTGKKKDLVQRLLDWNRNNNFRGPTIDIPDPICIPEWPRQGFKSLTIEAKDSLPSIRNEHICQYVVSRQCIDRGPSSNYSALEKGQKMEQIVKSISYLQGNEDIHLQSLTKAH